jgi:DNA-binding CsgD family transcriptional regulator
MFLSQRAQQVLAMVMQVLAETHDEAAVRLRVGELMLDLLGAQHYASFVWDSERQRFTSCTQINMERRNLARYERYYQYHDPITPQLQTHRTAVLVNSVMAQTALMRTEFFNDFLARDGLHWGINLYAWDGDNNIGDMRIWRDRRRQAFSDADAELLDLVRPAFTAALKRCRGGSGVVVRPAAPAMPALSERELDISRLVAAGSSDKQIARQLGISLPTVRTHVGHAFRKLGVHNRVELARALD